MEYGEALGAIGGLSKPSKMPWYGWSISATDCITGSKLQTVEGSVCANCYALKGRYLFPNVMDAHQRRKDALNHPRFVEAFVIVLTTLHSRQRLPENRFRWFDSGDLQDVEMLEKINKIAEGTPQIRHWLPTREVGIVATFLARGGRLSENLQVRVSAPLVGETFKKRPLGLAIATVGLGAEPDSVHNCMALEQQDNRCLDCDKCWSPVDVNYPIH